RRRRAGVPTLQPASGFGRTGPARRCPPSQALLSARPSRQVGAYCRTHHRARSEGRFQGIGAPMPRTLFEKILDAHVVSGEPDGTTLLYIDRHLVHEVTSPQAFEGLRVAGRAVHRPQATLAVADHNVPTTNRSHGITEPESRIQIETLEKNCADFGLPYFAMDDIRQGIVHIIGPEQGMTQPGMIIVCGDSHTATHGAFGSLAFGIGTSEVEHVLATQTLIQTKPRSMRIRYEGQAGFGVTAKDLILATIGQIGVDGA